MTIHHMTLETLMFIKNKATDLKAGISDYSHGRLLTSLCGRDGLHWGAKGTTNEHSCIAVVSNQKQEKMYGQKMYDIMNGYPKVSCPECIKIIKQNGL